MKIPIIATSLLKFGELWDKSINDLIREVGKKVLEDAGIQSSDIDSLFIANEFSSEASGQSMLNSVVFEELGISNVVCVKAGDASGSLAIKQAANSILAGQNKVSMVLGVEKVADLKCPEDGGDVIIKRTKKGKMFYGCSNYPNCKWASWTKPK